MVTIRHERTGTPRRARRCSTSPGPVRFAKASERLREGRLPELALVAAEGRRLVGTVRLWRVSAGPDRRRCCSGRSQSHPTAAIAASARPWCSRRCAKRTRRGHRAVLLVGDAPYYGVRLLE